MLVKFPRATRYPIKEANPCLTPHVFLGRRLTSPVGVSHHALPEVLACPLHDFATSLYRSTYGGCSSFFGFPARSRPKKKISRPAGLPCSESISLSVRSEKKKVKIFLSPDRGPTPSGSSTNSLYRAVLSSRSLSHIIRHFLTLGIVFE